MVGDRIKLARAKCGFSLRQLAQLMEETKVTPQAIGKYERGEMVPSQKVLKELSNKLKVSLEFLIDSSKVTVTEVEFRAKATTTAKEEAQVQASVQDWVQRYLQLETILELQSSHWEIPLEPRVLKCPDEAEELAKDVRRLWKLGAEPIANVTELLEEKGLKVYIESLPLNVSGLTCFVNRATQPDPVPVVVVNQHFPLERRRLTLLHELGHRLIDPKSSLSKKEEEKATNRFAAAMLMPEEHVRREVGSQRHSVSHAEVMAFKKIYKVSAAAFIYRLKDLQIIAENMLVYFFQSVGRTWRTVEPQPLEPKGQHFELPVRFERLCYRALAEKLISASAAAYLLARPADEIKAGLEGREA